MRPGPDVSSASGTSRASGRLPGRWIGGRASGPPEGGGRPAGEAAASWRSGGTWARAGRRGRSDTHRDSGDLHAGSRRNPRALSGGGVHHATGYSPVRTGTQTRDRNWPVRHGDSGARGSRHVTLFSPVGTVRGGGGDDRDLARADPGAPRGHTCQMDRTGLEERPYGPYRRGGHPCAEIYISIHPHRYPCPPSAYRYILRLPRSTDAAIPRPTAATREIAPLGHPASTGPGTGGTLSTAGGGQAAGRRTGGSRDASLIFTKSARRGSAHVKKWPTLYGKVTRARTTPIVNPVPENNFPARERLHGVRLPNPGRRVCVKARELSRLYVFPARLISFLVLVC